MTFRRQAAQEGGTSHWDFTGDTMNQTYTRKQATEKLELTSRFAFDELKGKYPHAFVVVRQGTNRGNPTLYDKQVLDKFAQINEFLRRQEGQL